MSRVVSGIDERTRLALSAYCDGELSRLAAWRLERRLKREAPLRAELAALRALGEGARELAAERLAEEPGPDLWPVIRRELARAEYAAYQGVARPDAGESDTGEGSWLRPTPLLAAAAAAAAAVALYFAAVPGPGAAPQIGPGAVAEHGAPSAAVRYLDTGGRPVLLEERADVTIIWLMDGGEGA